MRISTTIPRIIDRVIARRFLSRVYSHTTYELGNAMGGVGFICNRTLRNAGSSPRSGIAKHLTDTKGRLLRDFLHTALPYRDGLDKLR